MIKSIRWVVVLCVLLIPIGWFSVMVLSRIGPEERPPCASCPESRAELPQISVCELASRAQFAGRTVRVIGTFSNDAGQLFLDDGSCKVRVGFAREVQACTSAWRKLQVVCGVDTWYDGSASVRMVGSLSKIPEGNYYAGEEGFTVSCLEEVRTEPLFRDRERFAEGRLLPNIGHLPHPK